jgi:hypothetical protein
MLRREAEDAISRVGMINRVHVRGARNRKLTSRIQEVIIICLRYEQVLNIYLDFEQSLRGIRLVFRDKTNTRILGLMALVYIMCRIEH